jgi:hypothetical protein
MIGAVQSVLSGKAGQWNHIPNSQFRQGHVLQPGETTELTGARRPVPDFPGLLKPTVSHAGTTYYDHTGNANGRITYKFLRNQKKWQVGDTGIYELEMVKRDKAIQNVKDKTSQYGPAGFQYEVKAAGQVNYLMTNNVEYRRKYGVSKHSMESVEADLALAGVQTEMEPFTQGSNKEGSHITNMNVAGRAVIANVHLSTAPVKLKRANAPREGNRLYFVWLRVRVPSQDKAFLNSLIHEKKRKRLAEELFEEESKLELKKQRFDFRSSLKAEQNQGDAMTRFLSDNKYYSMGKYSEGMKTQDEDLTQETALFAEIKREDEPTQWNVPQEFLNVEWIDQHKLYFPDGLEIIRIKEKKPKQINETISDNFTWKMFAYTSHDGAPPPAAIYMCTWSFDPDEHFVGGVIPIGLVGERRGTNDVVPGGVATARQILHPSRPGPERADAVSTADQLTVYLRA